MQKSYTTRIAELKAKLKDDLIAFSRVIMPNMTYKKSPKMHYEWAEILMDKTKRKICIEAPRGFAKSSIVAASLPLHHLVYDTGIKYIVLQSKSEEEAKKRLRKIKNVLEFSEPFIKLYGYMGENNARSWNETKIILKDGSIIEAKGTGQQIRGLKEDDSRPTLLILDDPEDETNTQSETTMDNNFNKLLAALPGLDAEKGRCVVIGTPLHQLCIVERLMNASGWETRHYAALDENGRSLWEELHTTESLLETKAMLESTNRLAMWYSEYMCEVTGEELRLFTNEMLQYYEVENALA